MLAKFLHQRNFPQIAFCVLSFFFPPPRPSVLLVSLCKTHPLPFSFMGWILKCVLALILRARLAVTQACSRHDSHCGVCSLCLWNKAASVVQPASCFKHHMAALWRSPSSHPPLLSIFLIFARCHSAPKLFSSILLLLSPVLFLFFFFYNCPPLSFSLERTNPPFF